MLKTCESCDYWGFPDEREARQRFRACANPRLETWYRPPSDADAMASEEAVMVNGEAEGLLYTGPRFGCTQWQCAVQETPHVYA